jgi:hypothetical protein
MVPYFSLFFGYGRARCIARAMCVVMNGTVAVLCSSWLESAEPLRKVTKSVGIKLDDHTLDVGIIYKCVLPAQLPVSFRKVQPCPSREQYT